MKYLIIIYGLFSLFSANDNETCAVDVQLSSGIYEGLGNLYVLESNNFIEGYYRASRGESNRISTIFYFVGTKVAKDKNDIFFIKTFYPSSKDTINGVLEVLEKDQLTITLKNYPPGREFGLDGLTDTFQQTKFKNWKHIGYITCSKVQLMKRNFNSKYNNGKYLQQFECVMLKGKMDGFFDVEHIGRNHEEIGLLRPSCVALLSR